LAAGQKRNDMAHTKTQLKTEMQTRPPIVVVMGHVDHGKSSLLEAIREDFRITSKESGGITQHIGAYQAEYKGKSITFIDTPGHALFSKMRSRGTRVADIAVLVVAADEGVKPQTLEALEQIQKAELPFVVALNKIDKPEANMERVKQELAQHNVLVETYGGQVPSVGTSAISKQGIPDLLEVILLMAELEELNADPQKEAEGVVIEAYMDKRRGPTATLLVLNGTLHIGDTIATATSTGKVRIMEDFQKKQVKQAVPSMPAVVIGFMQPPQIGEEFRVLKAGETFEVSSAQLATQKEEPGTKHKHILNFILKADVAGSLEAIEQVVSSLAIEENGVKARVVKAEVGDIGENDLKLAKITEALIFGFHVKIAPQIEQLAQRDNIHIEMFKIIYELVERAQQKLKEYFEQQERREEVGDLEILATFSDHKGKQVIGGKVTIGQARKNTRVELVREGKVIDQGRVTNLQRQKKDAVSIPQGEECGIQYEGHEAVQAGDILRFYIEHKSQKP